MFLGNEIKNKRGSIDWDRTYSEAEKHMAQVGLHECAQTLIKDIGTGKQQLVEIAKAFSKKVKLLILDEPTSSLNDEDAKMLLDLLMEFKKNGLTSIIITHKLNEIIYCADRCTIILRIFRQSGDWSAMQRCSIFLCRRFWNISHRISDSLETGDMS